MDSGQTPVAGVLLFLVITIVYIVLVVIIQNKLSGWLKKRGEKFREKAEQDGRDEVFSWCTVFLCNKALCHLPEALRYQRAYHQKLS